MEWDKRVKEPVGVQAMELSSIIHPPPRGFPSLALSDLVGCRASGSFSFAVMASGLGQA